MQRPIENADEMFEKLGYKIHQGKTFIEYEKKSDYGQRMIQITIYKNLEYEKLSYPIGKDWEPFPEAITIAENKAIQKKLRELKKEVKENETANL